MNIRRKAQLIIRRNQMWINNYKELQQIAVSKGNQRMVDHYQKLINSYQGGIKRWEAVKC